MYKLIVSDLDETLIDSNGHVSQENLAAISKAQELGIRFVPATGRSFNDFQHILKMTNVAQQTDQYSISYNGGVITENKGNRLLTTTAIPFPLAKELFAIGLNHDVLIHVFTLDNIHTLRMNDNEKAYLDGHVELTFLTSESIDHLLETPIIKISFQHLDNDYLRQIETTLTPELAARFDVNYSSHRYIEFNPKGINKGNALIELMAMLNVKPEEVLAIGDNMNDRTLIQTAGTGISVANGVPELKELADYICTSTNDQSAVAEALETFIFNPKK